MTWIVGAPYNKKAAPVGAALQKLTMLAIYAK
jgi:hypothetical protein